MQHPISITFRILKNWLSCSDTSLPLAPRPCSLRTSSTPNGRDTDEKRADLTSGFEYKSWIIMSYLKKMNRKWKHINQTFVNWFFADFLADSWSFKFDWLQRYRKKQLRIRSTIFLIRYSYNTICTSIWLLIW